MKYLQEFKTAKEFMSGISKGLPQSEQAFIVVSHINSTSLPLISTLAKSGRIAGIIAKPNSIDFNTYESLSDIYRFLNVSKEDFYQDGVIKEKIAPLISPKENLTIIDIGGYFAPALPELNQMTNLTGIVEDTENGLQKYEKALAAFPQNKVPLFSVARSRAKDFEDYLIGRSIALSTMEIIRKQRKINTASIGIIGFGEVGRGTAFYLKDTLKLNAEIYDCNEQAQKLINLSGFTPSSRKHIIANSDILICATGNGSLTDEDIPKLKQGVYIASCTSSDDEFSFSDFKINSQNTEASSITNCQGINFLNKGNAINFLHPHAMEKILSPYIYLTHSALLQCAVKLNNTPNCPTDKINVLSPQEENKLIHNFRSLMKNVNANSSFINKFMETKLPNRD